MVDLKTDIGYEELGKLLGTDDVNEISRFIAEDMEAIQRSCAIELMLLDKGKPSRRALSKVIAKAWSVGIGRKMEGQR